MQIGDLVHAPRYPFWGMGIIVDREEEEEGMVCVYWFDDDQVLYQHCDWRDKQELEVL